MPLRKEFEYYVFLSILLNHMFYQKIPRFTFTIMQCVEFTKTKKKIVSSEDGVVEITPDTDTGTRMSLVQIFSVYIILGLGFD